MYFKKNMILRGQKVQNANKLEKNPYKGQLKLGMSGGEWNLEKLDEKVCGDMYWHKCLK